MAATSRGSQVLQCIAICVAGYWLSFQAGVPAGRALHAPPLSPHGLLPPLAAAMVNEAIQRCDVDVRRDMWGGIVLTGGGALLPGLRERLEQVMLSFLMKANRCTGRRMHACGPIACAACTCACKRAVRLHACTCIQVGHDSSLADTVKLPTSQHTQRFPPCHPVLWVFCTACAGHSGKHGQRLLT